MTGTQYPPGGPPAPGHRSLNVILRDAIRSRRDAVALAALRAEYDAAACALFDVLTVIDDLPPHEHPRGWAAGGAP